MGTIVVIALGAVACGGTPDSAPLATTSVGPSPPGSSFPNPITSTAEPAEPPFVDGVRWVSTTAGPSLQIRPTPSGRRAQGIDDDTRAWREVLARAPGADTPGMRAQFDCHWMFARLVEPDKPSWNIEPWRPVVTPRQMIAERCNPGGPEI